MAKTKKENVKQAGADTTFMENMVAQMMQRAMSDRPGGTETYKTTLDVEVKGAKDVEELNKNLTEAQKNLDDLKKYNISIDDIINTKTIEQRIKKLEGVLEKTFKKVTSDTFEQFTTWKPFEDYYAAFKELELYLDKKGQTIPDKYRKLFDQMTKDQMYLPFETKITRRGQGRKDGQVIAEEESNAIIEEYKKRVQSLQSSFKFDYDQTIEKAEDEIKKEMERQERELKKEARRQQKERENERKKSIKEAKESLLDGHSFESNDAEEMSDSAEEMNEAAGKAKEAAEKTGEAADEMEKAGEKMEKARDKMKKAAESDNGTSAGDNMRKEAEAMSKAADEMEEAAEKQERAYEKSYKVRARISQSYQKRNIQTDEDYEKYISDDKYSIDKTIDRLSALKKARDELSQYEWNDDFRDLRQKYDAAVERKDDAQIDVLLPQLEEQYIKIQQCNELCDYINSQLRDIAEKRAQAFETFDEIQSRIAQNRKTKKYSGIDEFNREIRDTYGDDYYDEESDEYISDIEIKKYEEEQDKLNEFERVLEKLYEKKKEIEEKIQSQKESGYAFKINPDNINYYNDSNINLEKENLEEYLEELNKVNDQIKFVEDQRVEMSKNFKPGDSWGGEEIQNLIRLLQILVEEIQNISKAFGEIDDESGVKTMIQQMTELSMVIQNAFNAKNLEGFSGSLRGITRLLDEIKNKKSEFNLSYTEDTNDKNAKYDMEWESKYRNYLNKYNRVIELGEKNGMNVETTILSMLNSDKVASLLTGQDVVKQFALGTIQNLPDVKDRIQRIMDFFEYLKIARKEIRENQEFDLKMGIPIPNTQVESFWQDFDKMDKPLTNMKQLYGQVQKNIDSISQDSQKAKDEFQNLLGQGGINDQENNLKKEKKQIEDLMSQIKELQAVLKQGLGIKEGDDGSLNYLNELRQTMEAVARAASDLKESLNTLSTKFSVGETDGGTIGGDIQNVIDQGGPYNVRLKIDETYLPGAIRSSIAKGESYEVAVKPKETQQEKTEQKNTANEHTVIRQNPQGHTVIDSNRTTTNSETSSVSPITSGLNGAEAGESKINSIATATQRLTSYFQNAGTSIRQFFAGFSGIQNLDGELQNILKDLGLITDSGLDIEKLNNIIDQIETKPDLNLKEVAEAYRKQFADIGKREQDINMDEVFRQMAESMQNAGDAGRQAGNQIEEGTNQAASSIQRLAEEYIQLENRQKALLASKSVRELSKGNDVDTSRLSKETMQKWNEYQENAKRMSEISTQAAAEFGENSLQNAVTSHRQVIDEMANNILQALELDKSSLKALKDELNSVLIDIFKGEEIDFNRFKDILYGDKRYKNDAGVVDTSDIKSFLSKNKVRMLDEYKAELGDDWKAFNQSLGNAFVGQGKGGSDLIEVMQQLEQLGHVFDEDWDKNNVSALLALRKALSDTGESAKKFIDEMIEFNGIDVSGTVNDIISKGLKEIDPSAVIKEKGFDLSFLGEEFGTSSQETNERAADAARQAAVAAGEQAEQQRAAADAARENAEEQERAADAARRAAEESRAQAEVKPADTGEVVRDAEMAAQKAGDIIEGESGAFSELRDKIDQVAQAISNKTEEASKEGQVVSGVVQEEITSFDALMGEIFSVTTDLQKLSDALKNLPTLKIELDQQNILGVYQTLEILEKAVRTFDKEISNLGKVPLSQAQEQLKMPDLGQDVAKQAEDTASKIQNALKDIFASYSSTYDDLQAKAKEHSKLFSWDHYADENQAASDTLKEHGFNIDIDNLKKQLKKPSAELQGEIAKFKAYVIQLTELKNAASDEELFSMFGDESLKELSDLLPQKKQQNIRGAIERVKRARRNDFDAIAAANSGVIADVIDELIPEDEVDNVIKQHLADIIPDNLLPIVQDEIVKSIKSTGGFGGEKSVSDITSTITEVMSAYERLQKVTQGGNNAPAELASTMKEAMESAQSGTGSWVESLEKVESKARELGVAFEESSGQWKNISDIKEPDVSSFDVILAQITKIREELDGLVTYAKGLQLTIDVKEPDITLINNVIIELKQAVENIPPLIIKVHNPEIEPIINAILAIKTLIGELKPIEIETRDVDVTNVYESINRISEEINNLQSKDIALKEVDVSSLTVALSKIEDFVSDVKTKVGQIDDIFSGMNSSIASNWETLAHSLERITTSIGALNIVFEGLGNNTKFISSETTQFDELMKSVDLVTEAILQKNAALSVEGTTADQMFAKESKAFQGLEEIVRHLSEYITQISKLFDQLGNNSGLNSFNQLVGKLETSINSFRQFSEILKNAKEQQEAMYRSQDANGQTTATSNISSEITKLEELQTVVDLVTAAILQKNDAFHVEGTTVEQVVNGEIDALKRLQEALDNIGQSLGILDDFFRQVGTTDGFSMFTDMVDKIKASEDALKSFVEILKKSTAEQEAVIKNAMKVNQQVFKDTSDRWASVSRTTDADDKTLAEQYVSKSKDPNVHRKTSYYYKLVKNEDTKEEEMKLQAIKYDNNLEAAANDARKLENNIIKADEALLKMRYDYNNALDQGKSVEAITRKMEYQRKIIDELQSKLKEYYEASHTTDTEGNEFKTRRRQARDYTQAVLNQKQVDINYKAQKKAQEKAEREAKKKASNEEMNRAFAEKQQGNISRLQQKYVEKGDTKLDEDEIDTLAKKYKEIQDLIDKIKSSHIVNKEDQARLGSMISDYSQLAQIYRNSHRIATTLTASDPEAAKQENLATMKQLMTKMKMSNADTGDLEERLQGIINNLNSSEAKTKEFFNSIRNEYKAVAAEFKAVNDEQMTYEKAMSRYERSIDNVAKAAAKLDFKDKDNPVYWKEYEDAVAEEKQAYKTLLELREKYLDKDSKLDSKEKRKREQRYSDALSLQQDFRNNPYYQQEQRKAQEEQLKREEAQIDEIEKRRAESARKRRESEEKANQQQANAINKSLEDAYKKQQAQPIFEAQRESRFLDLQKLEKDASEAGKLTDDVREKIDKLTSELTESTQDTKFTLFDAHFKNLRKELDLTESAAKSFAETWDEELGKIDKAQRKSLDEDHKEFIKRLKSSYSTTDMFADSHDNKGNWTGALAKDVMEQETRFDALQKKQQELLKAQNMLNSILQTSFSSKEPGAYAEMIQKIRDKISKLHGEIKQLGGENFLSSLTKEQGEQFDELFMKLEKAEIKEKEILSNQNTKAQNKQINDDIAEIKSATTEYENAQKRMYGLQAKVIAAGDNGSQITQTREYINALQELEDALIRIEKAEQLLDGLQGKIDNNIFESLSKSMMDAQMQSPKSADDLVKAQREIILSQYKQQMDIIEKAVQSQSQLNRERANMVSGRAVSQDIDELTNRTEELQKSAEEAKDSIIALFKASHEMFSTDELDVKLGDMFNKRNQAYSGDFKSVNALTKAINQSEIRSTKSALTEYKNLMDDYQKLFIQDKLTSTEQNRMDNDLKRMAEIEAEWNEQKTEGINLSKRQQEAEEHLQKIVAARNETGKTEGITKGMLETDAIEKEAIDAFNKVQNKINNMYKQSEWRLPGWGDEIKKLQDMLDNVDWSKLTSKKGLASFKKELTGVLAAQQDVQKSSDWQDVGRDWQAKQHADLAKWMNQNKDATKAFRDELEQLDKDIDEVGSKGMSEEWNARFQGIVKQAADRDLLGKSLGDRFKDQFKNTMTSLATYYLSFQDFVRYGREAIQMITELDTQLTEMRKVSNESLQTLQQYQLESFDIADKVGTTAVQIQSSTADWLRLGKNLPDASQMAELSNVLLNVSEFTDIKEATDALVSATQAYTEVAAPDIVDKLNLIGNNFAVSTDDLARGLQNAAAVLKTQGNDLDQTLALLTAGNLIGQDMSKASAGIRTIALRISGTEEAKNEIQDMGEDIDDFVVRTKSKTDQIIRDYTAVASNAYKGVSVLDDNGNLRDTYDILLDIAKVYKEIQAEDKQRGTNRAQALIETLAGDYTPENMETYFKVHI